jgi:hypothetical protein
MDNFDYMDREDELILLLPKASSVLATIMQLLDEAYSRWFPPERLML